METSTTPQGITLRPHQAEAVERIVAGLSLPWGGAMPVSGLRGQVHMSTGSGKTVTAAAAAMKLVPHGVIGVLVPTLDLLTQTIEAWRRVGHTGPAIAVCSLGTDPLLEALDVRCTTNPTQLALWAAEGPMLVFATYASLAWQGLADDQGDTESAAAPGALERALRGSYGQRMHPFDLLVVDEAHRTSGDASKAWACVHDQARIPAERRLYMTATPRLWEAGPGSARDEESGEAKDAGTAPQGAGEALGGRLVASMDDHQLYGEVLFEFGLMESVERGVLARFEIDVLEIRDPAPLSETATDEERRGRRLAALQAALLKHADETGVRSYMTFHSRTIDAMAFSRAMPETAARLHQADPVTYPKRVGSEWLSGEHPAPHRRDVLSRYADGLDAEGWVCDLSFLASCRVLGEGVDIRGTRGVGAVVFADTRSSPVEIVQIIGRALRQEPGEGKVSRILVPVFLEPGEDPGDMMASPSYRSLVAVLQGLRAHDDRVIEKLALPTTTARGQITSVLALDPQQAEGASPEGRENAGEGSAAPAAEESDDRKRDAEENVSNEDSSKTEDDEDTDPAEDGGEAEPGIAGSRTPLLRFSLPRDPESIALFLRTRILRPDSEIWLTGYNALRTWVHEYGHARVPSETTVPLGDDGDAYGLGTWVKEQRRAFRAGALKPWRTDLLNELGMVWSVGDDAFWKNLTAARAYYATHGSLAAPKGAMVDGVAVGQWLANLRKPGGLGRDPERADERRRALEAIDPDWNPAGWSVDWQRHYAAARTLLGEEQGLTEILPGVTVNGVDVGTWAAKQTDPAVWDALAPEQRARLERLGLKARSAPTAALTAKKKDAGAFERGITALTQYAEREGRVIVPRAHIEDTPHGPIRLGTWISNTRSRRKRLSAQEREQLAALGIEWAADTTARQEA
ncbi:Helicase associated domain protein (plasmid) [Streptomyces cyaneofuscatus]|uniref:DEAD/DEAH box helicase n=1 Tax=Streptomyces cyaneofuscatus TaxID=66883 RepID=UPI002F9105FD|nr:Helicase associated domain protein [Streptomyces cyaneofuscatus]